MNKKIKKKSKEPQSEGTKCCKVDALISIDGRGQIVLPKDVREKAGIKEGDKFAVISCGSNTQVNCIALIKAEEFAKSVKSTLGPLLGEVLK